MAIISKSIILFIVIGVVVTLFSIALATPGHAGYFTMDKSLPSDCFGNTPQGNLIAISDHIGGEFQCGTSVNVTCTGNVPSPCTGKSVVVKIVGGCPPCGISEGVTMDLSEDAYKIIASPVITAGTISIDYVKVS